MDPVLIEEAARKSGLTLDACMMDRLLAYLDYLKEVNRHTNLTAIRDDRGIARGHLQDSWQLLPHIPQGASVIDVGSGAGFPGLPLAIVRPDHRPGGLRPPRISRTLPPPGQTGRPFYRDEGGPK